MAWSLVLLYHSNVSLLFSFVISLLLLVIDLMLPSILVDKVQLSKSLDACGGTLFLNPSYNLANHRPDAVVAYSYGPTSVKVDAQKQQLTVTHCFGSSGSAADASGTTNIIAPTVSVGGDVSLTYSRQWADGSKRLTTTWTPDDAITVQWTDGGWHATLVAPLEGFYHTNGGMKVSMKRNVDVSW
jgi:hypothetical protein